VVQLCSTAWIFVHGQEALGAGMDAAMNGEAFGTFYRVQEGGKAVPGR
jgi:hypothetical protein